MYLFFHWQDTDCEPFVTFLIVDEEADGNKTKKQKKGGENKKKLKNGNVRVDSVV